MKKQFTAEEIARTVAPPEAKELPSPQQHLVDIAKAISKQLQEREGWRTIFRGGGKVGSL